MALVTANSLEGDTRARGFLECTIRITKRVREPKLWFFRRLADWHLIERKEYIYEKQGRYLG